MEVGHEALHRQLGVDGRLEVEHSGVGVLCDPLEHLVPEEQCDVLNDLKYQFYLLSPQMSGWLSLLTSSSSQPLTTTHSIIMPLKITTPRSTRSSFT